MYNINYICLCVHPNKQIHTHTHTHIYIYIYIYILSFVDGLFRCITIYICIWQP